MRAVIVIVVIAVALAIMLAAALRHVLHRILIALHVENLRRGYLWSLRLGVGILRSGSLLSVTLLLLQVLLGRLHDWLDPVLHGRLYIGWIRGGRLCGS